MDVKPQASNRWVEHIRKFANDNSISYREAMRSEACKAAYKTPSEPLAPLSLPVEPENIPEPLEMPKLERSEPLQPKAVKKVRVKRTPKLVPT
jgi:hypothetical protein